MFVSFSVIFGCCLLEACSFLKWRRSGWEVPGAELAGMEEGKIAIGMCCMREESSLNSKDKYKKGNCGVAGCGRGPLPHRKPGSSTKHDRNIQMT